MEIEWQAMNKLHITMLWKSETGNMLLIIYLLAMKLYFTKFLYAFCLNFNIMDFDAICLRKVLNKILIF